MKLRYSQDAIYDLIEIGNFIKADNPAAAIRVVEDLKSCCERFLDNPLMGRSRGDVRLNLRSFPERNYVIFYEPLPDSIYIVRVLHSSEDIDSMMGLN